MDIINHTEKWRKPRFFSEFFKDGAVTVNEDDFRHANTVLRMKNGDEAIVCDSKGTDYLCAYHESGKFRILESCTSEGEPDIVARLFQCLPKSDKMDFIVQKAVELGVSEIVPVSSERCVSRPGKNRSSKTERWNKIAYEAAKQCGRGIIPTVGHTVSFGEAVSAFNPNTLGIIFYECGGKPIKEIIGGGEYKKFDLFIGSEGGFTKEEIELAGTKEIIPSTLGKRILRVETASIAALSVLMNLTGNI